MKKSILIFILIFISICCGSTQNTMNPPFVIDQLETETKSLVHIDSAQLLTPSIELYYVPEKYASEDDYENREVLRTRVKNILINKYSNTPYVNLPSVYEDYYTVNGFLEFQPYYKFLNPKKVVSASEELITDGRKYGLIISINGRHGHTKMTILSVILVNNQTKTIERVIRYERNKDPLKENFLEKLINKALSKLMMES